jgi:hypothetical protein
MSTLSWKFSTNYAAAEGNRQENPDDLNLPPRTLALLRAVWPVALGTRSCCHICGSGKSLCSFESIFRVLVLAFHGTVSTKQTTFLPILPDLPRFPHIKTISTLYNFRSYDNLLERPRDLTDTTSDQTSVCASRHSQKWPMCSLSVA